MAVLLPSIIKVAGKMILKMVSKSKGGLKLIGESTKKLAMSTKVGKKLAPHIKNARKAHRVLSQNKISSKMLKAKDNKNAGAFIKALKEKDKWESRTGEKFGTAKFTEDKLGGTIESIIFNSTTKLNKELEESDKKKEKVEEELKKAKDENVEQYTKYESEVNEQESKDIKEDYDESDYDLGPDNSDYEDDTIESTNTSRLRSVNKKSTSLKDADLSGFKSSHMVIHSKLDTIADHVGINNRTNLINSRVLIEAARREDSVIDSINYLVDTNTVNADVLKESSNNILRLTDNIENLPAIIPQNNNEDLLSNLPAIISQNNEELSSNLPAIISASVNQPKIKDENTDASTESIDDISNEVAASNSKLELIADAIADSNKSLIEDAKGKGDAVEDAVLDMVQEGAKIITFLGTMIKFLFTGELPKLIANIVSGVATKVGNFISGLLNKDEARVYEDPTNLQAIINDPTTSTSDRLKAEEQLREIEYNNAIVLRNEFDERNKEYEGVKVSEIPDEIIEEALKIQSEIDASKQKITDLKELKRTGSIDSSIFTYSDNDSRDNVRSYIDRVEKEELDNLANELASGNYNNLTGYQVYMEGKEDYFDKLYSRADLLYNFKTKKVSELNNSDFEMLNKYIKQNTREDYYRRVWKLTTDPEIRTQLEKYWVEDPVFHTNNKREEKAQIAATKASISVIEQSNEIMNNKRIEEMESSLSDKIDNITTLIKETSETSTSNNAIVNVNNINEDKDNSISTYESR